MEPRSDTPKAVNEETKQAADPEPNPTVVEHHHYHYGNNGCKSWGCLFLEIVALIIFALVWMLGHPV